jgi:NADPH:quinone reductase-like Zn-dependent oxidoreductase
MSYKKVILNEFGGPQVLQVIEEAALPEPEVGEVRIKVLAASATFTDTMVRKRKRRRSHPVTIWLAWWINLARV